MATGGLTATRENLYYIGWGKQSAWGTAVAPTNYWRFLDGTSAMPKVRNGKEREGDNQQYMNLIYKEGQYWEIKVVERLRPITMGCALQAVLGSGSDTVTPATKATTLANSPAAGATTIQLTADMGNTGTQAFVINATSSSTNYETVTLDMTTRTTPNYTYTIAASGKLQYAHTAAEAISSGATHTFTKQPYQYDPYSIEFGLLTGGNFTGKSFRIQDCVCYEVKISGEKGKPLTLEHSWYGSLAAIQASQATPAYEGTNVIGQAGSTFMWYQGSLFKIDSLTTGNAVAMEKFAMSIKNSGTADEFQTEGISPVYFLPGNVDIETSFDFKFLTYTQFYNTYYGATAPSNGATDSYLQGYGALQLTFGTDSVNQFGIQLPNLAYDSAEVSPPRTKGAAVTQSVIATATKSMSVATPLTLTLTNGQAAAY